MGGWQGGCSSCRAEHEGCSGGLVYLPVQVVEEKGLSGAGVEVVVQMKKVAVGRTPGGMGFKQAVGIRTRREWCRHSMSREKPVGISGQMVQAEGEAESLVEGQEVWGEWTGQLQRVEDTDCPEKEGKLKSS